MDFTFNQWIFNNNWMFKAVIFFYTLQFSHQNNSILFPISRNGTPQGIYLDNYFLEYFSGFFVNKFWTSAPY